MSSVLRIVLEAVLVVGSCTAHGKSRVSGCEHSNACVGFSLKWFGGDIYPRTKIYRCRLMFWAHGQVVLTHMTHASSL